jgi:hypothetical protein
LNVTNNITVAANFAINTYTLTYNAGTNGSITGPTPQTVNYGADSTAVTAVPDSGYAFSNWSDGLTLNPRTDLNISSNLTVTANFVAATVLPVLSVVVSGSELVVSWPTTYTGWQLESQTNSLAAPPASAWQDVPGSSATNQMTFPLDPDQPMVLYRLRAL